MAFIYEVNGQRVEFDKEPTDADIDEAARQLGAPSSTAITQPDPALGDVAINQAGISAVRPVAGAVAAQAMGDKIRAGCVGASAYVAAFVCFARVAIER